MVLLVRWLRSFCAALSIMIQDMVGPLQNIKTWRGGHSPLLFEEAKPCTGTPCPCGGMKRIFSGTSIEMPGNDALRLAME